MSKAGKIIENPISGEKFRFIMTAEETDGDYFQFEWTLKRDGIMPFAASHPLQSKTFEVLSGELTITVDNVTEVIQAGGSIVVPREAVHQPRNTGEGALRCLVTLRPALHADLILETVCNLASAGLANKRGQPRFLRMAVLAEAYPEGYYAHVPIPVQQFVIKVGAFIGRMLGYQPVYIQR